MTECHSELTDWEKVWGRSFWRVPGIWLRQLDKRWNCWLVGFQEILYFSLPVLKLRLPRERATWSFQEHLNGGTWNQGRSGWGWSMWPISGWLLNYGYGSPELSQGENCGRCQRTLQCIRRRDWKPAREVGGAPTERAVFANRKQGCQQQVTE